MERVTGCFLGGHYLPALCGGEGGEDKLWDAAVAFECVPEKSLLCVLHRLISLCAKQHHTLFFSPPKPPAPPLLSEHLCTWHPRLCVCVCMYSCACRSVCLIRVELSHLLIWVTLISARLLALQLCVSTSHFLHQKKKCAKMNNNNWVSLQRCKVKIYT